MAYTSVKSIILDVFTKKTALAVLVLVLLVPNHSAWGQVGVTEILPNIPPVEAETAPVPEEPPTVQEVLLSVCETRGYGEDCAKTLFGMLWNESQNISTAIGDGGLARGYFQIHVKLHKISIACAEDLLCSADWSLTYMEAHSYPKYVNYAVQCHNSCGVRNGYASRALRNGKNLWSTPMAIMQASPIELALK